MSTKKTQTKPLFNVNTWMHEHQEFVKWWKNHWKSGFCQDDRGQSHWNITPWIAWESERYRAEFIGWSPDPVINAKISEWAAQQKEAGSFAARHQFAFSAKKNAQIWNQLIGKGGSESYMQRAVMEALQKIEESFGGHPAPFAPEAMRAKIDEAYEYEPGQSEEETELLRRRRKREPKTMTAEEIQAKARALFRAMKSSEEIYAEIKEWRERKEILYDAWQEARRREELLYPQLSQALQLEQAAERAAMKPIKPYDTIPANFSERGFQFHQVARQGLICVYEPGQSAEETELLRRRRE